MGHTVVGMQNPVGNESDLVFALQTQCTVCFKPMAHLDSSEL